MNRKVLFILLLLLTVCFCLPFFNRNNKNEVVHAQKVEVENKNVVGKQPVIKVEVLKK